MDRCDKVKSVLQKIKWLENIVQDFVNIDRHFNKPTASNVRMSLSLLETFERKLKLGRLITKSDMGLCNEILKDMKRKYKFSIDWRGNVEDCEMYTKFIFSQER